MLEKLPGIIRKSRFQEVVSGWDVNDETTRKKKELLQMLFEQFSEEQFSEGEGQKGRLETVSGEGWGRWKT